jgi:hypothetical protein
MQCACVKLSSVACPALQYFSILFRKLYDFRKKKNIEHTMCFDLLHIFSETFLILTRIKRDVINVHSSSPQLLVILVNFNDT